MSSLIWYDSTEAGAPVLNSTAGALVDVLRACLVTGFNSQSVTSISVASGVATVNCTAHGFTTAYQKLVLIEGCSEALLNGAIQPTSVTTNTFTFSVVGVSDGAYGGTITAKRAPLGWVEEHTAANIAIFKRTDVTATTNMLRVVDTKVAPASTTAAFVHMVDSATDANTYVNKVPVTDTYCTWGRGDNTAPAKQWAIAGDSKRIYVMPANTNNPTYAGVHMYFFGDIETTRPADVNGCFFIGHISTNTSTNPSGVCYDTTQSLSIYAPSASSGCVFSKKYDGSVVGAFAFWMGPNVFAATTYQSPITYPTILIGPYYLLDNEGIRAKFQIYVSCTQQPHAHLTIVQPDNVSDRFLTIELNRGTSGAAITPRVYIKLDGW